MGSNSEYQPPDTLLKRLWLFLTKAKDDAVIADAFPELADTGFDPVEVLMGNLFEPSHYVQTEGEPDVGTGTAAAQAPGEGPLAE
ncbi:MAG: hypothetical protein ABSC14_05130 [Desulfomonilia bacterium]